MRKQFVLLFPSGGMNPTISQSNQIDTAESSYDRLINRLLQKGLQPFDVGGCGDCFFRSVSHQYYGSPDFHIEIRQAGAELQHKERLEAKRHRYKENLKNLEKKKVSIRPSLPNVTVSKEQYLSNCYTENLGPLHEQPWAKENISKFHNSNNYTIYQCITCFEVWPLKSTPKCINNYQCTRCSRE